ncbi:uncharacterized protein [Clytia hemisphaerica]|uniref:uncharacterized protein n=1 Tax=Clytia hemisphaerica TaxID=252671 RepID=UPI0034D59265
MSYHCIVIGCQNGSYKLKKWKKVNINHVEEPPFQLFPVPTLKKHPEKRSIWRRNINRLAPGSKNKLLDPSKDARVCSEHFVDGRPTEQHPYPTKNMGYDFEKRSKRFNSESLPSSSSSLLLPTCTKRRKSSLDLSEKHQPDPELKTPKTNNSKQQTQLMTFLSKLSPKQNLVKGKADDEKTTANCSQQPIDQPATTSNSECHDADADATAVDFDVFISPDDEDADLSSPPRQLSPKQNLESNSLVEDAGPSTSTFLSSTHSMTSTPEQHQSDQPKNYNVKNYLGRSFQGTFYKKLIKSDKKCNFYTNISSRALFEALFKVIWPYTRKRYSSNQNNNKKSKKSTKTGRQKILSGIDEVLLTMMKLKLGLYFEDLGDRFGISTSTASRTFTCWIRAMALCLNSLIYMPDEEVIRATLPSKFSSCSDVVSIIDCSEIFIQTPKDLELQAATWSEYKHHNTVKFLISTTPNSFITFVSEPYTGRISDKAITNDTGFLDTVPSHTRIMADKGFNIQDECVARLIHFLVPPGRRGSAQMTPNEVKTTTQVGKLRILVEQVIRRVKTFRIIAEEVPLSLVEHLNDILIVCCGLSNLKGPIIKDRDI